MESISSPLESGLDLPFLTKKKRWWTYTVTVPGPSLKKVLAWDYCAVKKPKLATWRGLTEEITNAIQSTAPGQPPDEIWLHEWHQARSDKLSSQPTERWEITNHYGFSFGVVCYVVLDNSGVLAECPSYTLTCLKVGSFIFISCCCFLSLSQPGRVLGPSDHKVNSVLFLLVYHIPLLGFLLTPSLQMTPHPGQDRTSEAC